MHIDPEDLIDIDGCSQGKEDYFCRYGYSPRGKECVVNQIVVLGKSYNTMAAVTPGGFLCWQIFDIPVTGDLFSNFVTNHLSLFVNLHQTAILDNATVHKNPEARIALDRCFHGAYFYCALYSPHLKPIEKCFALVKAYIRQNEIEATLNPVAFINSAFALFAIGGPRATSIRGHWNDYFGIYASHLEWVEENS